MPECLPIRASSLTLLPLCDYRSVSNSMVRLRGHWRKRPSSPALAPSRNAGKLQVCNSTCRGRRSPWCTDSHRHRQVWPASTDHRFCDDGLMRDKDFRPWFVIDRAQQCGSAAPFRCSWWRGLSA